jgi:NADH-quinone oxidoreductase subunit L
MMHGHIGFLIVLLPLFAAVVGGLFASKLGESKVMWLTTSSVVVSAVLSWMVFLKIAVHGAEPIEATLYTWLSTTHLNLSFGVLIDKLTAVMLIVVTTVSACVHVYSFGYMSHDNSKSRFFSYLSLFTFAMLLLVTAPNLLQMFMGWEGVGLASYLLIGFWFKKPTANAAAMKAFIVNRVADVGLLLGTLTTFWVVGSLAYSDIFAATESLTGATFTFLGVDILVLELLAFFFLIGAMGKSAQIGFHTWLPDAMEGPTPVSALIHAATMVTAGVFLLARLSPIFEHAESILTVLAWVGALTALFAATIGLTQKDIKRVVAYSTCSQLGYMFFACGISAYPAAIFHLTTHAFFKALLFLAAGSVIHGMHNEQNMFKMGGLRKALPITYVLMWIGSLALMGIPPFAGFFSKDLILESAFMAGSNTGISLYIIGTVAAFMTAFYSCRVMYLTFYGEPANKTAAGKAHESPLNMLLPMYLLGIGAVLSGYLLHNMGTIEWWNGAIFIKEGHDALHLAHNIPALFKYLPLGVVIVAIVVASVVYLRKKPFNEVLAKRLDWLYSLSFNKWFVDELYHVTVVKPVRKLSTFLWHKGDEQGIDRLGPNGAAWLANKVGQLVRTAQTGFVYHYAFVMIIGVCTLVTWIIRN